MKQTYILISIVAFVAVLGYINFQQGRCIQAGGWNPCQTGAEVTLTGNAIMKAKAPPCPWPGACLEVSAIRTSDGDYYLIDNSGNSVPSGYPLGYLGPSRLRVTGLISGENHEFIIVSRIDMVDLMAP